MTTADSRSLAAVAPARHIDMDRRRCVVTPDRVAIRPSRALILLPGGGLTLGLLLVAAAAVWQEALPLALAVLLLAAAMVVLAISSVWSVFLALGAELVVDRGRQSVTWRRGLPGLGSRETVPFANLDRLEVEETAVRRKRGLAHDVVRFAVVLVDTSGRRLRVGAVTVRRPLAADGLERARLVAEAIAGVAGKRVEVAKPRRRRPRVVRQHYLPSRR